MSCACKPWYDVRCVCHPVNKKTWKKCPVKAHTAYFLIFNNYDDSKLIEQKTIQKTKTHFTKKYGISDLDWEQIQEWYKEEYLSD